MAIDYLIALDFETTCFASKNQVRNGWYQEIIDFGACLINLNNGRIVENYQSFVQPTEFSITYGCMKTLGISNKTVDGYPPLKCVLSAFQKWVNDIRYDYDLNIPYRGRSCDDNAYFCSWSNMDLGSFLRKECYNKDISYANYMKWWLNAQEIYYDVYGRKAPGKLNDAANYVGTRIVGQSHSALDDAATLAKLSNHLFRYESFDYDVKSCY